MTGRYRRVETGTFSDRKFRELSRPQPNARDLWVYLLCGERTTIFPGLVIAREEVIASDFRWPLSADLFAPQSEGPRCFREAWKEIADRDMARADWDAGIVILPRALLTRIGRPRSTARPNSPNDLRGWAKAWPQIPDCALSDWYLEELGRFAAELDRERAAAVDDKPAKKRSASARRAAPVRGDVPNSPYMTAYLEAFESALEALRQRSENHPESRARAGALPVPVPVPVSGTSRRPDQVLDLESGSSEPSSIGPRVERVPPAPPVLDRGALRNAGRTMPPTAPPGDPRADTEKRLLRDLAGRHAEIFNRIRDRLRAQVPAMQLIGDPAERALRELIKAQVTLEGFEEKALHVLAVREHEAIKKSTVKFLGASLWEAKSFGIAASMEIGEERGGDHKPSAFATASKVFDALDAREKGES